MNTKSKNKIRRILALALVLSLLFTQTAFAEESMDEALSSEASSSELAALETPEESSEESAPPEESSEVIEEESAEEGENTLDTEEESFAASPLLITGTHTTYLSGYKGGYFKPENYMTRAEVSQMLYNLLGTKPAVSASQFTDLPSNNWAFTAVNALESLGIINGYSDGTFKPGKTITRAEFVTLVSKCFTLEEGSASFSDVSASSWAYPYIASATAKGWLNGYSDGTFRPSSGIKRCEAVKIMNVALERKDENFALDSNVQKFVDVPKSHWAFYDIAEAANPVDGENNGGDGDGDGDGDGNGTEVPSEIKVGSTVIVTATGGLNLREAPVSGTVITILNYGSVVTVTALAESPWIQVKTSAGKVGYVSSEYVKIYVPGQAAGAQVSTTSLTMNKYQSARLDASVTVGMDEMIWTSSDANVAVVGYTLRYNSTQQGAIIYAKNPGTTTLTFKDKAGTTSATCKVTVKEAEPVRVAYCDNNIASVGVNFNLTAVTDASRTGVKFQIVSGPATGTYETTTYKTESQNSKYGLPTNTVRVFTKSVSFSAAGTYTVRAYSKTSSGSYSTEYYQFTVLVTSSSVSATTTTTDNRRASAEMLKIIANFEGSVPDIEDDVLAPKNPTVGHGIVIGVNRTFYNTMTPSEMFAMLAESVNGTYTSSVNNFRSKNSIKMSQAQFDALVSFVYNCGTGVLTGSYYTPQVMINAVVPPTDASETKPYTGTLNVGDGVIYEKADIASNKLATVPNGKTVSVIGVEVLDAEKKVWYNVKYDTYTGWMPAGYVRLSASGLTRDLAYADSTVLANNFLQWHKAGSTCYVGLIRRRMAEAKLFFHGNYAESYHTNANYKINTYGFVFPSCCAQYDMR